MVVFPGPRELGRGVVLGATTPLPAGCERWPRVVVGEGELASPRPVADVLHRRWLDRQPVAVVLHVDLNALRALETCDSPPWQLEPTFEFSRERLARLVTANNYDCRTGTPVWGPTERAVQLGAARHPRADVTLPDGRLAWCDGGPRQPIELADAVIVHRESIELGSLRPDEDRPATDELAADQLAAVVHQRGPARIIAPAGSGKTRVLTARLRHILRDRAWTPGVTTAVAYNNRAAAELRARTAGLPAQIRTLNSLGLAIVNGTGPFRAHSSRREVADESSVRTILESLIEVRRRANTDIWAPYITALSAIRLGLTDPLAVEVAIPDAEGIGEAFDRYRAVLADRGLIDFDEQIYGAIEVMLRDPEVRRAAQRTCRHLLVDEFQDLTPAHMLMLRLLAAPAYDVFGVGDDDQVIYGYASASPEFLIDYDRYFPGAANYALEVNYRCPVAIVDSCQNLLSHNSTRIPKVIRAPATKQRDRSALQVVNRSEEEHAVAAVDVLQGWHAHGDSWHDMAVLTRVNSRLLPIQVALVGTGIACTVPLDASILRRTGIRTALAYLRIGLGPDAIASADFSDTIRRPSRRLSREVVEQLGQRRQLSITELRREVGHLGDGDADKLALYVRDLDAMTAAVKRGSVAALRTVRDEIGLGRALDVLDASRREADRSTHTDDLAALEQAGALHPDAATFEAWLGDMLGRPGASDGVVLSTVHRVKGQEWPRVLVFGADSGSFPHRLATNVEEERRIFHVAITRAALGAVVLTSADAPSPLCAELDRRATPPVKAPRSQTGGTEPRSPARSKPRQRAARPKAPAAVGLPLPVTLGLELQITGGVEVQVVDWKSFGAVAVAGKSRLNLPWGTPVTLYGRTYELVEPPPASQELLMALKTWRTTRARSEGVGIDHVLTDAQLHTIALHSPRTLDELSEVPLVGPAKLEDFGDELLSVVDEHRTNDSAADP